MHSRAGEKDRGMRPGRRPTGHVAFSSPPSVCESLAMEVPRRQRQHGKLDAGGMTARHTKVVVSEKGIVK